MLLKRFNAFLSRLETAFAFKVKWRGHDTNGQDTHFFRNFSHDWRCTGTGTTAHTRSNKDHIGPFKLLADQFTAFFCCGLADLRICTCTQTTGTLLAQLNFKFGFHAIECLLVRIGTNKLYALDIGLQHMLYSITTRTTYTKHSETGLTIAIAMIVFEKFK